MTELSDPALLDRWFPIARGQEAPPRHVVHAQLLGREIALWRADDGRVNAWENRCPHRGVRLSVGLNTGVELKCQYHGWRFASGDGRCAHIPALPSLTPPRTLRASAYAVAEQAGYLWVSLGEPAGPPPVSPSREPWLTCRGVFMGAPAFRVAAGLASAYGRLGEPRIKVAVQPRDAFTLDVAMQGEAQSQAVALRLQPVAEGRTVVHAALSPFDEADALSLLRRQNAWLNRVRDAVEADYTKPR